MFRFTTTTLINSLTDHNGLNVISTGGTASSPTDPAYFQIKRVGKFYENCVTKVTQKKYAAPVMATAKFNTGSLVANTLYRIKLYIRLNGSNEALNNEAIRVLGLMPKWIPGENNGEKVNVKCLMPIDFTIDEDPIPPLTSID